MPLKNLALLTFEDRLLLDDEFAKPGTLAWLLRDHRALLFAAWLFKGWKGEQKEGRDAWPAPTLAGLLLLRHSEAGMTDVGAVRTANTDAAWRGALRLPWRFAPPDEKTVREFETFMKQPHPEIRAPPDRTGLEVLDAAVSGCRTAR